MRRRTSSVVFVRRTTLKVPRDRDRAEIRRSAGVGASMAMEIISISERIPLTPMVPHRLAWFRPVDRKGRAATKTRWVIIQRNATRVTQPRGGQSARSSGAIRAEPAYALRNRSTSTSLPGPTPRVSVDTSKNSSVAWITYFKPADLYNADTRLQSLARVAFLKQEVSVPTGVRFGIGSCSTPLHFAKRCFRCYHITTLNLHCQVVLIQIS